MGSKSSSISIGIRKATKIDLYSIQRERTSFNMPHAETFVTQRETRKQTTFIAFNKKTIVGFITLVHEANNTLTISDFYNRIGFDRKGIGSKLLGKANAYAVKIGAKKVRLYPGSGYHLVNGKKEFSTPHKFYEDKTNYKFQKKKKNIGGVEVNLENFIWEVKRKQTTRKLVPKRKPRIGLAPQNLMRKDRMITRRRK